MTLHHGDCLDVLRTMPDNSVDSIVTDPPYGLSFMGKKWDYDVPSEDIWRECLRVLKPGGHLLAFAGTRTQHRMAVRIEDAGFEIRDMLAWVYGSGFPKSLDVSKAIDKVDAAEEQERRRLAFTAWVRSQGVTSRQIDEATGTNMGGHYTTAASQPRIMTREHLDACRHLLGDVPEWVEREADIRSVESRNMAEREVVGVQKNVMSGWDMDGGTRFTDRNITAPATPEAQQWAGWGTALKPALEPITVARKPLGEKTVAANVLAHGTGG
jgi:SAM-dependent methyltransferase